MTQEFKDLQKEIHELAQEKRWWIDDKIPDKLLMIHSEVSEAVECYRNGEIDAMLSKIIGSDEIISDKIMDNTGKPWGYPIELADIIIRVMDLAERNKVDLWKMIKIKHEYNKTRPYRHGGKKL